MCDGCHGNIIFFISVGQGAMFAAAEDFSHLIDDDIASSSSLAGMIGAGAVSRHDNAGKCFCRHLQ